MTFLRDRLPDPVSFFEGEGLTLKGPGKWKTTRCESHGGSDSMRINSETGAWVCMACGVKGGDALRAERATRRGDWPARIADLASKLNAYNVALRAALPALTAAMSTMA